MKLCRVCQEGNRMTDGFAHLGHNQGDFMVRRFDEAHHNFHSLLRDNLMHIMWFLFLVVDFVA